MDVFRVLIDSLVIHTSTSPARDITTPSLTTRISWGTSFSAHPLHLVRTPSALLLHKTPSKSHFHGAWSLLPRPNDAITTEFAT